MLDIPYAEVDKIAKMVPDRLNIRARGRASRTNRASRAETKDPRVEAVLDIALTLEGMVRNAGVHAAASSSAATRSPNSSRCQANQRRRIVTQYDMDGIEKIGLLKMDFLGLTTLTIIDDSVRS